MSRLYPAGSQALEVLHGALVLLRGGASLEGTQVAAFAGSRILLPRIQPIHSVRQLSNQLPLPRVVGNRKLRSDRPRTAVLVRQSDCTSGSLGDEMDAGLGGIIVQD
jgi:hypothetical protein